MEVIAKLFSKANLSCSAEGFPSPVIYWFKNDQPVPDSTNRNYLIFNEVALTDRGYYHCMASNSEGTVESKKALVNIEGMHACVTMHAVDQ